MKRQGKSLNGAIKELARVCLDFVNERNLSGSMEAHRLKIGYALIENALILGLDLERDRNNDLTID